MQMLQSLLEVALPCTWRAMSPLIEALPRRFEFRGGIPSGVISIQARPTICSGSLVLV